jgi:hypothetical protein
METAEILRRIIRHELHNDDLEIVRALKNPKGKSQTSKHEQYIEQWRSINPVFHPDQRLSINTIDVPHLDEAGNSTNDPD